MGFDEVIRIWRSRAGLTAGLVLLALISFAAALAYFPATYQSSASVVLLASRAASRQAGGNPFLGFSPALSLTADVVSRAVMGPATASQLANEGYGDAYTVTEPAYTTTATGSVLIISVTGKDPGGVERTMRGVIGEITLTLNEMQGGIRPRAKITVSTLASSPQATLETSATVRPMAMTLAAGLIVAFGLPVILDGLLRRRRARLESTEPVTSTQVPGPPSPGDPAEDPVRNRLQTRARHLSGGWTRMGSR